MLGQFYTTKNCTINSMQLHFNEDQYEPRRAGEKKLKMTAVPTIFLPEGTPIRKVPSIHASVTKVKVRFLLLMCASRLSHNNYD